MKTTRGQFFAAISGALASVLPASEVKKPVVVEEFSPKGKLYVVKVNSHISSTQLANIKDLLKPHSDKLGCEFIICGEGADVYSPDAPRPPRAHGNPTHHFASGGYICGGCQSQLIYIDDRSAGQRRMYCGTPYCKQHKAMYLEPTVRLERA